MKDNDHVLKKYKNKRRFTEGFTLAELLIVVAIIAVLVAISIPIFTSQLHKAEVATDWANLRAYYAEIQADYISTGKFNDKVPDIESKPPVYYNKKITFLSGQTAEMKAGYYMIRKIENEGYQIIYYCDKWGAGSDGEKHDKSCSLILGASDKIS